MMLCPTNNNPKVLCMSEESWVYELKGRCIPIDIIL